MASYIHLIQDFSWLKLFSPVLFLNSKFTLFHFTKGEDKFWSRFRCYFNIKSVKRSGVIIQKESCITLFIAALFTIARTWKQPKCALTDEWIKKMWHIYTMEYYSAIKRNKIESFVARWMD